MKKQKKVTEPVEVKEPEVTVEPKEQETVEENTYQVCQNCGSNKVTKDFDKAYCQNCGNAVVIVK